MGLFRKLLGREPGWTETWSVYPGEVDEHLAMYHVDLGAVDAAPVPKLPVRVDVEFDYRGDGASGMPGDRELVDIRGLEEAVRKAMSALGGAYVGRVLTGNTGHMVGYLPSPDQKPQFDSPVALTPRLTLTPDPAWSGVRDELAPDEWQRNLILDMQVVASLEEHGDHLETQREVEHLAYFPEEPMAQTAARELADADFAATVERDDEGGYAVQAIRVDAVVPPAIHGVTWLVRQVVERHGGVYDGWGCIAQS
jgi:hypothetical protein